MKITYQAQRGLSLTDSETGAWLAQSATADLSDTNVVLVDNGSVTESVVNTGAETKGYSGYTVSVYQSQSYQADHNAGTGSFSVRFWLKDDANGAVETVFERDSTATAQRITITITAAGYLEFAVDDGTTVRTATMTVVMDDNTWSRYQCYYDGSGGVYILQNGSIVASTTGTALLTMTNTAAIIGVGRNVSGLLPLTKGTLSLLRYELDHDTVAQDRQRWESEKILFYPNEVYTQVGVNRDIIITPSVLTRSVKEILNESRSLDGTTSTNFHREEYMWDIKTTQIHKDDISEYRRFLESTKKNETFVYDAYGLLASDDLPVTGSREGSGYSENRYSGSQYFNIGFKVRER